MNGTGLEIRRRHQPDDRWDVIHTASGLPVHDPIVTRFERKRDAQKARELLLELDVDWTLRRMREIAASGSCGMDGIRQALAEIGQGRDRR